MKRLGNLCVIVLGAMIAAYFLMLALAWVSMPDAQTLARLKDGDIIFHTGRSSQGWPIMLASGSLYNHVALVQKDRDGALYVIEASATVRKTPIGEFIARSHLNRIMVKRLKDLSAKDARKVLTWSRGREGKPYDYFFLSDDREYYCSELVYDAFDRALGTRLGKTDRIGDLHLDFAPVRTLIANRWEHYPPCREKGIKKFDACLGLIKAQELITPAALAEDMRLETVYTNYWFW